MLLGSERDDHTDLYCTCVIMLQALQGSSGGHGMIARLRRATASLCGMLLTRQRTWTYLYVELGASRTAIV